MGSCNFTCWSINSHQTKCISWILPSIISIWSKTKYFPSRIFGCAVYAPIAPPQRTKIGPQRRLRIYVGYEFSSIIRYLEPKTDDVFTARFADCHFNEAIFSALGGEKKQLKKEITWSEPSLLHLDPYTKQWESEVQKIILLQK